MALALDSPRIPNGNGELWKGRDKSKFNQCECCPYGYHIDLDFVRFCENVSQRNDASLNKERRRERRLQRQSMEVLLGLTSQSFWNIEQQLPKIHQEPPVVVECVDQEEKSTLVRDALYKAVQDFEDTLERTHKLPTNHQHDPITDGFTDVQAEAVSSGDTSLSSMSAVSPDVDNEGGLTAAAHEALLQDFDVASIGSATSGHSHAALQNIRQQMALSLERMRDLEEQVKLIPVLQVHLAVAKEEKRKMALLLQENKLEMHKLVSEAEPSQFDDASTSTSQESPQTTRGQQRKSRRDIQKAETGGRKSRQVDDKVPLLKEKPKVSGHANMLLPADMWLLNRQMELISESEKTSDTHFETAVRTQLSTYNIQADSLTQHPDNQSSRFGPQPIQQATGKKADFKKESLSTPLLATKDIPQKGAHTERNVKPSEQLYIMKPKVVYPTTQYVDTGARRKEKHAVHPETSVRYPWDKTENDVGEHHERRHRQGHVPRRRSRSVSEVAPPKEPCYATGTLRRDKPKRDVQVQTIRHLVHVSTQSDIREVTPNASSLGQTTAPVVTEQQRLPFAEPQSGGSNCVPKDILSYTVKLSVQAFDSYLNQCEGSLMRSRFVNKQDQIDIFKGTLKRIMGKAGLIVESSESSSAESVPLLSQAKPHVKKVSLKTLDEPRTPLVGVGRPVTPIKPVIKFTNDRGTSCALDVLCKSCLNKPPKKVATKVELKTVSVQTKPIEPTKVPLKPALRDQATITDALKFNTSSSVERATKPELKNASAQTTQTVEEKKSGSPSVQEEPRNILIDIGIDCTIDDFWCVKCQSNLDKVIKSEMKSKLVQTKVSLGQGEPAAELAMPEPVVLPSSVEHSPEKESPASCQHGIDSPLFKAPNVYLENFEEKQKGDFTKSNAENTIKCVLEVTPDTLKSATPIPAKPFGMTEYVSQSLAEPKFLKKTNKSVFTQTEVRELSPTRNISTNTSKMKMVDRRVGDSLPLQTHLCTCKSSSSFSIGQTRDEKEKRSSSQDRESRIPRPASMDGARKLQRQTTYTKLDVPESDMPTEGLWTTTSSDLSSNQGSEIWPSVSTTVPRAEEEALPDVLDDTGVPRSDGSRQRRSGASSTTTSTSASSLASSGKTLYNVSSEPCQTHSTIFDSKSTSSLKSTESSEKSTYLPGSSEIRKDEVTVLLKDSVSSESAESSLCPPSSEANKFDVIAPIELARTGGSLKPTVTPYISRRPGEHKNPNNETSKVQPLSKFLERPLVENTMTLPLPFASPSLAADVAKEVHKHDPEFNAHKHDSESNVSSAESLMPLPRPFNSPSFFEIATVKRTSPLFEEQPSSAKGKSGRSKTDSQSNAPVPVSAIHQPRGATQASRSPEVKTPPHVLQTTRNAGMQPNAKTNATTGKKTSGNTGPVQGRPKPLILPPSDQKEAYELIKKSRTPTKQRPVWDTQDPKLPSPVPAIQGTSSCSDGFTLQSKEEILDLSASERPQKVDPSTKMKAALKVVNDLIIKSPTMSELGNTAKAANAIIQREWFQISSTPSADPHIVEDYLDHFEEMSSTLLTYVVNMADKAGNTAMHYALSQGNFDVVSILLDSKVCNINLPNAAGYTAVMLVSLAQIRSDTHRCVLQRFLADADVNVRAQQHGQTALMLAVSHNRLDMVQLLIEGGADLNIQDDDGSTALMCAAEHGHAAIVQFLINQPDTDLNIKDVDGLTALDIALDAGHKDVGILLYAHKHFSRNNSPYSSLRGRRSKSATPTTRTASTPPPRTPSSPLPVRQPPRHSHD